MAKKIAKEKAKALDWILEALRVYPTLTIQEQVKGVERFYTELKPETIEDYHEVLVSTKQARWTIVPLKESVAAPQKFYIFIETTFQREHAKKDEYPPRYQEQVAEEIKRSMGESFADDLYYAGIEILLGGDWDMVLTVHAKDQKKVHDLVIHHVRTCPHVLRTSTVWAQSAEKNLVVPHESRDAAQGNDASPQNAEDDNNAASGDLAEDQGQ